MEDLFTKYLKHFKNKSKETIEKNCFELIDEIRSFGDEKDDEFVYLTPLITSFLDGHGSDDELDFVNRVNEKYDLGYRKISLENKNPWLADFVNGSITPWLKYILEKKDNPLNLNFLKRQYDNTVKYVIACLSRKKVVAECELDQLNGLAETELTNKNLSYDLSEKEEDKQEKKPSKTAKKEAPKKAEEPEEDQTMFYLEDIVNNKEKYRSLLPDINDLFDYYLMMDFDALLDEGSIILDEYSDVSSDPKYDLFIIFLMTASQYVSIEEDLQSFYSICRKRFGWNPEELPGSFALLDRLDDISSSFINIYLNALVEASKGETTALDCVIKLLCLLTVLNKNEDFGVEGNELSESIKMVVELDVFTEDTLN